MSRKFMPQQINVILQNESIQNSEWWLSSARLYIYLVNNTETDEMVNPLHALFLKAQEYSDRSRLNDVTEVTSMDKVSIFKQLYNRQSWSQFGCRVNNIQRLVSLEHVSASHKSCQCRSYSAYKAWA